MPDLATNLLLSVAGLAGAFVSEPCRLCVLRGRGRDPAAHFPADGGGALMMACSIGVQAANLWALRRNIQWEAA